MAIGVSDTFDARDIRAAEDQEREMTATCTRCKRQDHDHPYYDGLCLLCWRSTGGSQRQETRNALLRAGKPLPFGLMTAEEKNRLLHR